ncbi:MAG: lipopolysaccharide biosynthesis protein, partial [Planctomycetia bacterium]
LSLFGTTSYIALLVVSLGLPQAFLRFYTEAADADRRRRLVDTAFRLLIASTLVGAFVAALSADLLQARVFNGAGYGFVVMLVVVNFLTAFQTLCSYRMQADGRATTFLWISLVSKGAIRGLSLACLLWGMGPWGWLVGEVAGLSLAAVLTAVFVFHDLGRRYDAAAARDLLPYGVCLLPAMLSHWVMTGLDKYMLNEMTADPLAQIGLYTVGERIGSIVQLFNVAFLLGWRGFAFRVMHQPEGPWLLARGVTIFALAGGYATLVLALLGDDLTHWMIPSAFEGGLAVIPPLTLAGLFAGAAEVLTIGLHKERRTLRLSWITAWAAGLNFLLNLWLIPRFGIMGAAYATVACQALQTFWMAWASQAAFPLPLEYKRLAAVVGLVLSVYAAAQPLALAGWATATLCQTAAAAAVPFVLWWAGFFRPAEKAYLLERWSTLVRRGRRQSIDPASFDP